MRGASYAEKKLVEFMRDDLHMHKPMCSSSSQDNRTMTSIKVRHVKCLWEYLKQTNPALATIPEHCNEENGTDYRQRIPGKLLADIQRFHTSPEGPDLCRRMMPIWHMFLDEYCCQPITSLGGADYHIGDLVDFPDKFPQIALKYAVTGYEALLDRRTDLPAKNYQTGLT